MVPLQTVEELRRRLIELSAGYSEQRISGSWMHEGRVYTDPSVRYDTWLRSWRDIPAFLDLVDWAREAFSQITMGIVIAGIPEEV